MRAGKMILALATIFGVAAIFVAQKWPDQTTATKVTPAVAAPSMKTVVVATRPLRLGTEIKLAVLPTTGCLVAAAMAISIASHRIEVIHKARRPGAGTLLTG
jgi:Flp pilus assembly protein CpaB